MGVLDWNAYAAKAIVTVGGQVPPRALIRLAMSWPRSDEFLKRDRNAPASEADGSDRRGWRDDGKDHRDRESWVVGGDQRGHRL